MLQPATRGRLRFGFTAVMSSIFILQSVLFSGFCLSPFHHPPLLNPPIYFQPWYHPHPSFHASYQFQPCLLDGEYLSIRAVSLSSASFCSSRNWETDCFSTPGLVGREGRLCSLDQCRCWLALLDTHTYSHTPTHTQRPFLRKIFVKSVLRTKWMHLYDLCSLQISKHLLFIKWMLKAETSVFKSKRN